MNILHNSLLVYENKYYLEVYIVNCAYKILDKQIDYLDHNVFETDKVSFFILISRSYKCYITIELTESNESILLKVIAVKDL